MNTSTLCHRYHEKRSVIPYGSTLLFSQLFKVLPSTLALPIKSVLFKHVVRMLQRFELTVS